MKKADKEVKSLREAYGKVLAELGEKYKDIVVLTADLVNSTYTKYFAERFPNRFFNVGVAEANMMGIAAGLAMSGKRVFASTFAVFAAGKPWEQIRQTIAYQSAPVRIVATHAGITVGLDGASHQMLEDISNMRVLPNMAVIVPVDAVETEQVIKAIAEYDRGPVYVRLSREAFPAVLDEKDYQFELGKAKILRDGDDVTLFGIGLMVSQSLEAADILKKQGISAQVVNVSTIKPIDEETIRGCAKKTGAVVTVEEHNIIGGLGSAVSEVIGENQPVPIERVGIRDKFGESGNSKELIRHFGLTPENIAESAQRVIERKVS